MATGTRFVAFATAAGYPRLINRGRLITDPPELTVLRKPSTSPASASSTKCIMGGVANAGA
jgi:hypothetical protein